MYEKERIREYLKNYPRLERIAISLFLKCRYLRTSFIYNLARLTSHGVPAKKYSWAIMKGPRNIAESWSMYGEKTIQDLIANLAVKGVCVDAGAWVGKYSFLLAKTARRVIAIEPDKLNFRLLQENIDLNDKNIEPIQAALDYKDGEAKLALSNSSSGHGLADVSYSDKVSEHVYGYKIKTISLNSLLNLIGEDIDFIKMDIQGAEFRVLRDADENVFSRVKRWLVEVHRVKDQEEVDLESIFKKHGYSVERVKLHDVDYPTYIYAVKNT